MTMTHTPAYSTHHPDRFEDDETGAGYSVYQDTDADDPRGWIGDDSKVAVYVYSAPRGDKDDSVPENPAVQAFVRFYELWDEAKALEATKRWLAAFRPEERYDLAIKTIRGYSQGDWADVIAASVIDHEDGTPGHGTAEGHIDLYASWRWGDVWVVSPDSGDALSGIYASDSEAALEAYLQDSPPAEEEDEAEDEALLARITVVVEVRRGEEPDQFTPDAHEPGYAYGAVRSAEVTYAKGYGDLSLLEHEGGIALDDLDPDGRLTEAVLEGIRRVSPQPEGPEDEEGGPRG